MQTVVAVLAAVAVEPAAVAEAVVVAAAVAVLVVVVAEVASLLCFQFGYNDFLQKLL